VDREGWRLADAVLVKKEDLSLYVQPLAKLVTAPGYRTTVDDLLSRMVVDSDSAATDVLLKRLGGPPAVRAMLQRHQIEGIRVDRDERHLQTEIVGLSWHPEYVDASALRKAIEAVSEVRRQKAFDSYLADARDTATPDGMATLLTELQTDRLLSVSSTRHLLELMTRTTTFPDRLKAGLSPGWAIGHKTGSGGTWKGMTVATNDVGILTAPDGGVTAAAVFIKRSSRSETECGALIAAIAREVVLAYR
jgi:beta-lactamase class A